MSKIQTPYIRASLTIAETITKSEVIAKIVYSAGIVFLKGKSAHTLIALNKCFREAVASFGD